MDAVTPNQLVLLFVFRQGRQTAWLSRNYDRRRFVSKYSSSKKSYLDDDTVGSTVTAHDDGKPMVDLLIPRSASLFFSFISSHHLVSCLDH